MEMRGEGRTGAGELLTTEKPRDNDSVAPQSFCLSGFFFRRLFVNHVFTPLETDEKRSVLSPFAGWKTGGPLAEERSGIV